VEQEILRQQVHHKEIMVATVIQVLLGHLVEAVEQHQQVLVGVHLDQVQEEQVQQLQFQHRQ
jgi:heme exporter protein D